MDATQIGGIIRQRREFVKFRQQDLAEVCGTTARTIHSIESGKGNFSFNTLMKLTEALGLELKLEIKNTDG